MVWPNLCVYMGRVTVSGTREGSRGLSVQGKENTRVMSGRSFRSKPPAGPGGIGLLVDWSECVCGPRSKGHCVAQTVQHGMGGKQGKQGDHFIQQCGTRRSGERSSP